MAEDTEWCVKETTLQCVDDAKHEAALKNNLYNKNCMYDLFLQLKVDPPAGYRNRSS